MYRIVYAQEKHLSDAIEKVEKKVNLLKTQGWVEQGGISVSRAEVVSNFYVAQAMVKND